MLKSIIKPIGLGCVLASTVALVISMKLHKPPAPLPPPPPPAPETQTPPIPEVALAKPAPVPASAVGVDVLAEVKRSNSSAFAAPPHKFRAGHVTVRPINPRMVRPRSDGYAVKFPSGAPIVTPTIYGGMVLSSGGFHSREFYAFDAETGQPRWAINLDDDGPSVAACEEGLCAFNTESCTLFVVDAQTGKMRWSLYLGDPLTSAPTIMQGKVFASYPAPGHAKATHVLAAFDLKTGAILWQRWIDADVMSAPVAIGAQVYASTFAGTLYMFEGQTGEITSARRVRATSAPTISGDEITYSQRSEAQGAAPKESLGADNRRSMKQEWRANDKAAPYLDSSVQAKSELAASGKALDASNGFGSGAPSSAHASAALGMVGKGSVSTMQAHQGSRVLKLGRDNVSAQGDELVSVGSNGQVKWSTKMKGDLRHRGGALAAPPVAAGGKIVLATLEGKLLEVDSATGATLLELDAGGPLQTQPAVMNGWIYVGTSDGRLIAINTHDPKLTGWSTWGGDSARSNVR
jgi:outer membrane protein assembly factor BamB